MGRHSKAIRKTWLSPSEVPTTNRGWRTKVEGQTLWWEPGVEEAVFEVQFTGPDRTMFMEMLKKRLTQQGPRSCQWDEALVTLLSPLVGSILITWERLW